MGLLTTAGVSLLSLALIFQEPTPTPVPSSGSTTEQRQIQADQLLRNAKQVALFGTVGNVAERGIALNPSAEKAQKYLEKEVQKWGRFTVTKDPTKADVVLILAEGNRAAGGGGVIRTARLVVFPGGEPMKRGEIPLWDGQANGSIFATSGAPKVISQFRAYLEELDKRIPAVAVVAKNTEASTSTVPANRVTVPANSGSSASEAKSSAASAPTPTPASKPTPAMREALAPRPAKYVPPLEIIAKAKTFSLRGKGATGSQGKLEKFASPGQFGNVHSAMGEVYQQLQGEKRWQLEEDVSKADIVFLVFQWDTRTYSRQFHGVRTAIQVAEGGAAFQREDPSLWVSGTASGPTSELINDLWIDLARFEHSQAPNPTHAANKEYNRGCDLLDSGEKKSGGTQSDLLFEAVAEFRKSLRTDPNYAPTHERLGTALLKLGYDSAAAYEFKQALQLQPNTHDTSIAMAKALAKIPDYKEAEQSVRDALRIYPDNKSDHLLLGDLFNGDREYPAAINEFSEAVRLEPRDSVSQFKLGTAYYRNHQMKMAEAAFREAIRIKPDDANSMLWLGSTLNETHRPDEAITVLRAAEKINPKDGSIRFELARALGETKNYEEAIREIHKALELEPTAATYHFELGHLLLDAGKVDEALNKFHEIVKNLPQSPAAHDGLGRALLLKSQTDEAVAEFEQAIKLDPKYAVGYFDLGRALDAKGEKTRALEAYQKAHDLEPENEEFKAPLKR